MINKDILSFICYTFNIQRRTVKDFPDGEKKNSYRMKQAIQRIHFNKIFFEQHILLLVHDSHKAEIFKIYRTHYNIKKKKAAKRVNQQSFKSYRKPQNIHFFKSRIRLKNRLISLNNRLLLTECLIICYYETEYQKWGNIKQKLHKAFVQKIGNVYEMNTYNSTELFSKELGYMYQNRE